MMVNREDLKAFIDGELPAMQAEVIRHELETSGELAQEVTFLKLIGQGVRDCSRPIPVSGADEALQMFRKKRRNWVLELGLASVLVVVICTLFFPVFSQSKASAKRTAQAARFKAVNAASGEGDSSVTINGADDPTLQDSAPMAKSTAEASRAKARIGGDVDGLSVNNFSSNSAQVNAPTTSTPPVSAGDAHRMVVQNGDLDEVVRDVSGAQNEAMDYVKALGGFIQSSSMNKSQTDVPEANLNVRVPARTFTMAMDHFKSLAIDAAHIKSANVTGEDVTAQYADSTARMRVLAAEEDSYVTMLKNARRLGEVLAIKDRLSTVRQQIEALKSESEALKNQSDLSTISLTFEQEPKVTPKEEQSSSWSSDAWASSVNGLQSALQFLGTVLIFALVYSPIWVPIGLIGLWLYRRNR